MITIVFLAICSALDLSYHHISNAYLAISAWLLNGIFLLDRVMELRFDLIFVGFRNSIICLLVGFFLYVIGALGSADSKVAAILLFSMSGKECLDYLLCVLAVSIVVLGSVVAYLCRRKGYGMSVSNHLNGHRGGHKIAFLPVLTMAYIIWFLCTRY